MFSSSLSENLVLLKDFYEINLVDSYVYTVCRELYVNIIFSPFSGKLGQRQRLHFKQSLTASQREF